MITVFVTFTDADTANQFVRDHRDRSLARETGVRPLSFAFYVAGANDSEVGFEFNGGICLYHGYYPESRLKDARSDANQFLIEHGLLRKEREPRYEDRLWPPPPDPLIDPTSFGIVSHRVEYLPRQTITKSDGTHRDINDLKPGETYCKPKVTPWQSICAYFGGSL